MGDSFTKYFAPENYWQYFRDKRQTWRRQYQENIQPYTQWPAWLLQHPSSVRWFGMWRRTWKHPSNAMADGWPWFTFPAIQWLETFLQADQQVFEWGSGGSTVFIAPRVKKIVSIEHDAAWYESITVALQQRHITNCQLIFKPAQPARDSREQSTPFNFRSWDESLAALSFENYVRTIDDYPDQSFDLIIADGRARMSCLVRALSKVRPGGFVLLDDAQRPYYEAARQIVNQTMSGTNFFGPTAYHPIFKSTMIWQKPAS